MTTIRTLAVSIVARTKRFEQGMKRSRGLVHAFSRSLRQMAVTTLAPLASGYLFLRIVRNMEEFQQAMNSSIAIMGRFGETMRSELEDVALRVARVTKFTAAETARAYYYLTSAGMSVEASLAALGTVAKFAQAGMFNLARATELVTDAQSALGLASKNAEENLESLHHVANILVRANTLANASVEQFSEALTHKAAAAAKFLGISIEETVAVLAAFADQGIKGSDAGTAFNIVTRDLTTKAIANAKAFEKAGVAVYTFWGKLRPLPDIVGDLEKSLALLSDRAAKAQLKVMGFSDKSLVFTQTLMGTSEKMREFRKELEATGDAIDEVASKQLTAMQKGGAKLGGTLSEMGRDLSFFADAVGGLASLTGAGIDTLFSPFGALEDWVTRKPAFLVGIERQEKNLKRWREQRRRDDEAHAGAIKRQNALYQQQLKVLWGIHSGRAATWVGKQWGKAAKATAGESVAATQAWRDLERFGKSITEKVKTPLERLGEEADLVRKAFAKSLITQETFWRYFKDIWGSASKGALGTQAPKLREGALPGGGLSGARSFNRKFDIAVPGLALDRNKAQLVKDPQLAETNNWLEKMTRLLGGGTGAVAQ